MALLVLSFLLGCGASVHAPDASVQSPDEDGDGHDALEAGGDDCDDARAEVHPGADEIMGDGIDQDCSGADALDADGDGFASTATGGADCDDSDARVHPGALDQPAIETIGPAHHGEGTETSLALDATGGPHVAFVGPDGEVLHGVRADSGWVLDPVDTADAGPLHSPSIVVAADGARIAYIADCSELRYAEETGGEWTLQTVDIVDGFCAAPTLVPSRACVTLDDLGESHVAYNFYDNVQRYAERERSDGPWSLQIVMMFHGRSSSLAMDHLGFPHVAFFNANAAGIDYWTQAGGGVLDLVASPGDDPAIALDPRPDASAPVQIAYSVSGTMWLARRSGGAWSSDEVLSISPGAHPMRIGVDGTVHIVRGGLEYLTDASGEWVRTAIDAGVGWDASLALDAESGIHATYLHANEARYARFAVPNGLDDDCDGEAW